MKTYWLNFNYIRFYFQFRTNLSTYFYLVTPLFGIWIHEGHKAWDRQVVENALHFGFWPNISNEEGRLLFCYNRSFIFYSIPFYKIAQNRKLR